MAKQSGKSAGKATRNEAGQRIVDVPQAGGAKASGSQSPSFQAELIDQLICTLWLPQSKNDEKRIQAAKAAFDALGQIAPHDELEGMLAAQMIATHSAAMECLRRAMMEGQSFEGRDQNLKHAAKFLQIYARQLEALDKHRGKGQQKITVEHVNVHSGGQAIIGDVHTGGKSTAGAGAEEAIDTGPKALADQSQADAIGKDVMDQLAREAAPVRRKKD